MDERDIFELRQMNGDGDKIKRFKSESIFSISDLRKWSSREKSTKVNSGCVSL